MIFNSPISSMINRIVYRNINSFPTVELQLLDTREMLADNPGAMIKTLVCQMRMDCAYIYITNLTFPCLSSSAIASSFKICILESVAFIFILFI